MKAQIVLGTVMVLLGAFACDSGTVGETPSGYAYGCSGEECFLEHCPEEPPAPGDDCGVAIGGDTC